MSRMAPLAADGLLVDPPVVLAPMAGITNRAFRRLCREQGAGLYVSEMVTSRALVERHEATLDMVRFDADESPRSVQLYGVDPATMREAVTMLVAEDRADHIDLNFGCPVPKVTRKGGGSALPWKRDLFEAIVTGAVQAAGDIPLTVKMRKGIDPDHLTYLDAAKAAEQAGEDTQPQKKPQREAAPQAGGDEQPRPPKRAQPAADPANDAQPVPKPRREAARGP